LNILQITKALVEIVSVVPYALFLRKPPVTIRCHPRGSWDPLYKRHGSEAKALPNIYYSPTY